MIRHSHHSHTGSAPMRGIPTERLLSLGMALYADKRTMEQRVRGIFAKNRSARFARVLSVVLCGALFIACFTTACMPVREMQGSADIAVIGGADGPTAIYVAENAKPEATGDSEAAAATPSAPKTTAPQPPADPIGSFIKGLQSAAFAPVTAPSRVIRNPETIGDGVTLTYDASVTIPDASAYAVTRLSAATFSDADADRLRKLFHATDATGEGRFQISENGLYYVRYGADVTRKTWVHYELDWQPDEIALFDEPIPLTRAQTQPVALQALADMGADGYVLDSADEAIAIGYDADGAPYAVSKGWEYVFVPQSNGLPRHNYGGWFGAGNDPVFYCNTLREYIWLYVDEQGVSRVSWHYGSNADEVIAQNVALISLDEVIRLANARFARLYARDEQYDGNFDIRVQNIRLAAMPLSNDGDATEAYCVPVWELEYSLALSDDYRTICVLPFNAVDGGAVIPVDFPF